MKRPIWTIVLLAVFAFSGMAIAADGASIYASKCQMCHGANGAGGAMGPKLAGTGFIKGEAGPIKDAISKGVPMDAKKYPNFPMAMPGVALSDVELDAVVVYLKGL